MGGFCCVDDEPRWHLCVPARLISVIAVGLFRQKRLLGCLPSAGFSLDLVRTCLRCHSQLDSRTRVGGSTRLVAHTRLGCSSWYTERAQPHHSSHRADRTQLCCSSQRAVHMRLFCSPH